MALIIVEQDGKSISYTLKPGAMSVGRVAGNDIILPHATVSGKHAQIITEGEEHFVEDVGSRNGTFVNGQRISARTRLAAGVQLSFGQLPVKFEATPVRAEPKPAPGKPRDTVSMQHAAAPVLAAQEPQPSAEDAPLLSAVNVDFTSGDADSSAITGTIDSKNRFGVLDASPEVKLKAVLDISTSLAGSVELEQMLPNILQTLFNTFRYADRGCILLKDDATGEMKPRAIRHRREEEDASVRLSRTIVQKVLTEKTGILSADAATDERLSASESISELRIRSMMCVPMLGLDGEPVGIISIDSQNPLGQFNEVDLEVLLAVAGQAALCYENTRLMQSFMAKQKQDNEMEIAKGVQHALLPEELPEADGWEFFASYDSAQAVGGDYYDCFMLPGDRICLSFGDVAGKGVPGALIMSRMSSCVQSTMRHVHDVEQAINAINDHMCDSRVEGRFVTYVLVVIDPAKNEIQLANAGHMSPLIRRADGRVEQFDDDLVGPPIGVVDDYPYEVDTRTIEPGETVVIVTDGVDEAMNPEGDFYTTERVIEFVRDHPPKADVLGRELLADVRRHANGRPQNDDITIMTFGRNPS